jgi:eukaryotic-like serine/threonine-protein kinase
MSERSIFLAVLEIDNPVERAAYLDRVCAGDPALRAQVEQLLNAHQDPDPFMERPACALVATMDDPVSERPGTIIGPYKLLEQIGEGGFGVVFMAEQQHPVRRKVALKVLKPGMDTKQVIARFEAERQALALMDHPNIAHVFDGGATESGRPYFVMELVRGVCLTDYCDQSNLPIHDRLELFVHVCQAVQHAHQKGIIHRDIKPSNILVTLHDGVPVAKVIDFGIAKATGLQLTEKTLFTNYAQMIGTPLYMSPEQAEMSGLDVDTRSDIYSLGVLLYELLTGATPFDKDRLRQAGFDEIRRIIREEEPPRPSTRMSTLNLAATTASTHRQSDPRKLSRMFRGELDWIVMKALEKDRNRRYESASAFAADVRRYLLDEPVLACPPSVAYRFRKIARRNKARLAVVGVGLIGLVLAVVGLLVNNQQIKAEQKRTGAALESADDQRSRAEENLKLALQALDEIFIKPAEEEVYSKQREGKLPLAPEQLERVDRKHLQKGLEFYDKFAQANSTNPLLQGETGKANQRAGYLHMLLGQNDKAEIAMRKSIVILEPLAQDFPESPQYRRTLVNNYHWLGQVLSASAGRSEDAEQILRQNLDVSKQLVAEFPKVEDYRQHLHKAYFALGRVLLETGKFSEPEGIFRDVLRLWPDDPNAITELGIALYWQSRLDEAIVFYREAIKLNKDDSRTHDLLGIALQDKRQLDEALAEYREAIRIDNNCTDAHVNLGIVLYDKGQPDEAIAEYREALRISPDYSEAHLNLGTAFANKGQLKEAFTEYLEAIRILEHANQDVLLYRQVLRDAYLRLTYFLIRLGVHAKVAETAPQLPRVI